MKNVVLCPEKYERWGLANDFFYIDPASRKPQAKKPKSKKEKQKNKSQR